MRFSNKKTFKSVLSNFAENIAQSSVYSPTASVRKTPLHTCFIILQDMADHFSVLHLPHQILGLEFLQLLIYHSFISLCYSEIKYGNKLCYISNPIHTLLGLKSTVNHFQDFETFIKSAAWDNPTGLALFNIECFFTSTSR